MIKQDYEGGASANEIDNYESYKKKFMDVLSGRCFSLGWNYFRYERILYYFNSGMLSCILGPTKEGSAI